MRPKSCFAMLRLMFSLLFLLTLTACTPAEEEPVTEEARVLRLGQQVYSTRCQSCHQASGLGVRAAYPPLVNTEWVEGDEGRLIRVVLMGMRGEVEVNGVVYNNIMTSHDFMNDNQVAAVLTYIRQAWGNTAGPITPDQVRAVRATVGSGPIPEASWLWEQTGVPGEELTADEVSAPE